MQVFRSFSWSNVSFTDFVENVFPDLSLVLCVCVLEGVYVGEQRTCLCSCQCLCQS